MAFFDDDHHLWIELTSGKLPPKLMVENSSLFLIEHGPPKRVMVDLTAYIALIQDIRR